MSDRCKHKVFLTHRCRDCEQETCKGCAELTNNSIDISHLSDADRQRVRDFIRGLTVNGENS